ncbi:glycosyltransferase family 4 protein [Pseudomonas sp. Marseille-QA0892]
MLVTLVTETYPPDVNGVALTVLGFEQRLRAFGHSVNIVRPRRDDDGDTLLDTLCVSSIKLPRYPGLRLGLPAGRRLKRQWRTARPDVIYVATEGLLGATAILAARSLGIPVVTGYHTRFDHYMSRYRLSLLAGPARGWLRGLHNLGRATIVSTAALQRELTNQGYRHVRWVPRAVDAVRFNPAKRDVALRAQWGAASEVPVLLHVGRIAPEKNVDLAIRAFRAVQRKCPAARMVLVGDGPLRDSLQSANPDLIFAGNRHADDLAAHYASADIFLFPSLTETFGNVTLEALASGLATVAFDDGAAREHIMDGVTGRLATQQDEDAFIAAAVGLAGDPDARSRMATAGRACVAQLDPISVARAFEQVLMTVAQQGDQRLGLDTPGGQLR